MDKTLKILLTVFVMALLIGISAVSWATIKSDFFVGKNLIQNSTEKIVYVDRYIEVPIQKNETLNSAKIQVKIQEQKDIISVES